MSQFVALLRCERAAAAAEMALIAPLLILLLAGLTEIGYYFYAEHRLVEGVRDAARYAARQPISNYASCPSGSGTTTIASGTALFTQTRNIAKTGDPVAASSERGRLWGWESDTSDTDFTLTYQCFTTVTDGTTTTTVGGIYEFQAAGAPVVTVDARVPHSSIFAAFGIDVPLVLNASQQAVVAGA